MLQLTIIVSIINFIVGKNWIQRAYFSYTLVTHKLMYVIAMF